MTTTTTPLNDVNLAAVSALASHIQQRPQAAQTTWKADVQWTGAFTSKAQVRHFAPIRSDEPTTLGGSDTAPNPVEQLLAALGNCLAVGYAANASAQGIAIRSLSISLEGTLDLHAFLGLRQGHAGFDGIRVQVQLEADATPERIEGLHRTVVGSSPVGHTLQRAVPVSIELAKPAN
jgi:uncharacterized OsmC-like protein